MTKKSLSPHSDILKHDNQKFLALTCLKEKLFVEGWQLERVFKSYVGTRNPAPVAIYIHRVNDVYIGCAVVELRSRLMGVYIKPEFRRQGYGKLVVKNLLEQYGIDVDTIYGSEGDPGSKEFYEGLGILYYADGCIALNAHDIQAFLHEVCEYRLENVLRYQHKRKKRVDNQIARGNQFFYSHPPLLNNFFDIVRGKSVAYVLVEKECDNIDKVVKQLSLKDQVYLYRTKQEAIEMISDLNNFIIYRVYLLTDSVVEIFNRDLYDMVVNCRFEPKDAETDIMFAFIANQLRSLYNVFFIRKQSSKISHDLAFLTQPRYLISSVEKVMECSTL